MLCHYCCETLSARGSSCKHLCLAKPLKGEAFQPSPSSDSAVQGTWQSFGMLSANGSGGTRTGKRDRQFSDKEDGTDEPVPAPDGARPPTKKRPRTSKHSQRLLRSLPSTRDLFWQQLTSDHASAAIWDKNHHGLERLLPGNETVAMALNEIAADGERGFFYYLPSREYWKTPDKEPLLPVGRAPGAPGYVDEKTCRFYDWC